MGKDRLINKTAIITGGTAGIGEATVRHFVSEGAKVVFCGRREESGQRIVASLPEGSAIFVKADVTVRADLENLLSVALEKLGNIDILVNNSGIAGSGPFETFPMEKFDKVFAVNFRSCVEFTQMVIPHMIKQSKGVILNASSCGGRITEAGGEAYCTTKAALISFSRCIAKEYATRGIRCNAVCPGCISTDMAPAGGLFEQKMMLITPMKRPGTVDEVALSYVFLASDEASYITGTAFAIDGGVTAFN